MSHAPNSLAARDIAYMVHPFTQLRDHEDKGPIVITKGDGIYVENDDGRRMIEGMAGLWCAGLGFSNKRLVEAARRQLELLPYSHTFAHRSMEPVIELADKLISIAPEPLRHVWFCCSGSEAIDSMIKTVWYYQNARGLPEKKIIIGRERGYHGMTIAGSHLTGLPYAHDGWDTPMMDRFRRVTPPNLYRYGYPGESEDAFTTRLARELDELILAEGSERVAAFVAEPVMGAGGVIPPAPGYFEKIQKVLKRHDVLMVADEVICGFGRTGEMWGSTTYDIAPDMMTCAKQMSSAYMPISAVLMSDAIYQAIADHSKSLGVFGTGFTYGGHPVSAAVALEAIRIYEEEDIVGHVQSVSHRFMDRLDRLEAHPLVGEARGVGLIAGLEIVADKGSRAQFPKAMKAAAQIQAHCQNHDLILRALPGDVLAICPPMIITAEEVDLLFDRLEQGLKDTLLAMPKAA